MIEKMNTQLILALDHVCQKSSETSSDGLCCEAIHFFDDKVSLDDNTYTQCHNPLSDKIINVTL